MSNPLISIGDFGPAAKTLVERASDAIGGLASPWQIRRVARAQVEADIIQAEGKAAILDVERRALNRLTKEEGCKQANIESITAKAIPLLSHEAKPEKIETDWLVYFFDRSRIISNDDMQFIWSSILAGEANSPGSFSRRTMSALASLDKQDAEDFTALCGFVWDVSGPSPLIYNEESSVYSSRGFNFDKLNHLEDIGLISYSTGTFGLGYSKSDEQKRFTAIYHNTFVDVEIAPDTGGLHLGRVIFSKTGEELRRVCKAPYYEDFSAYVLDYWKHQKYIIHDQGSANKLAPST